MIHVIQKAGHNPYGGIEIDTTSKGSNSDLSPFNLGPVEVDGMIAMNVENLWQFSKVYPGHEFLGEPSKEWYAWRDRGFASRWAQRYPMGKGKKPLYSFWRGQKLDYITARKEIYVPAYASCVVKTESFRKIFMSYREGETIVLRDFDGYDHRALGISLKDVINNPNRSMGHAFVIVMILEDKLPECILT
jgi:hypothetical protein